MAIKFGSKEMIGPLENMVADKNRNPNHKHLNQKRVIGFMFEVVPAPTRGNNKRTG